MKVGFVVKEASPGGGLSLATFRLAAALAECGHQVEVLHRSGEAPADFRRFGRRIEVAADADGAAERLPGEFEAIGADVLVVGSGSPVDLQAAARVAPTVLHAHLHVGACPDRARYWNRVQRPCSIQAGWKCAPVRPFLGCSSLKQTLSLSPIAEQTKILDRLVDGEIGVLCVSSSQAELYRSHGVPAARIAVLPNLGMRATADELAAAADRTPEEWRAATVFVGRLGKEKGAKLLGAVDAERCAQLKLRVFGEGYLRAKLAALPAGVLCGQATQDEIAGVMMWARSLMFPSLWPEPGGIVGIDAQVMGVPVAAFDVGAARDWPAAELFPRGEIEAMIGWLTGQRGLAAPRDPGAVAAAQVAYWDGIGRRAAELLGTFAARVPVPADERPAEGLIEGPVFA
jgi:glycosyltransferase involved in cell wall biosynthesis